MRFFITFTLFVLSLTGCNSIDVADIQEGDIVFIESQSRQSPYIKVGTMSKWTHCGVIVSTSQGLQVLEASKTVRLTPVDKFIGASNALTSSCLSVYHTANTSACRMTFSSSSTTARCTAQS